jgi:eukaryotic-like serine/threonine-protein kinase
MDSEHWKQVQEIFDAVMEREADDRDAFLERMCTGDDDLRLEIENLLAYERPAADFLEAPALEVVAKAVARDRATQLIGEKIGRYAIVSWLGSGGMGEVFLAEDSTLGRRVALKFLPVDVEADGSALRRLMREAQAAAKLDHPNVCAIHEVGHHKDTSFIVMQYIEGETLASLIKRGPLAPAESIRIAFQIADALAEAHSHGIIHRDVKPQNIMLTHRGQVKVLDFGLARLEPSERPASGEASTEMLLTQPGVIAGTAPYMSPEQLRGEPLDGRTDIFSLGAVLYEMLTGSRAFGGVSNAETIAAVLEREPAPLDHVGADKNEIQEILNRCLAKDRAERYATAKELAEDLAATLARLEDDTAQTRLRVNRVVGVSPTRRRAAWVLTGLLLLAMAAMVFFLLPRGETINSIAVLSFSLEGATSETEYLTEAIPQSIINKLSEIPGLKVISSDSSFHFKTGETDLKQAGRDLGARALLSGRIVRRGEMLWISATLVDSRDNRSLWGEQFSSRPNELITLQERISQTVSDRLRLRLTDPDRRRLAKRHTESSEAYTLYLKGRFYLSKLSAEGVRRSIDLFRQALQSDPGYALAYAGLADSYSYSGDGPEAKNAALAALNLDDSLGEAHASLGWAKLLYDWDWKGAEAEIARGIELNPNYPLAHHWYAVLLGQMARYDEAISEGQRAQELDPLSPNINLSLGLAYVLANQPDRAKTELEKVLEMDPGFAATHNLLGLVHLRSGRYQEAIAEYQRAHDLVGENPMARANIDAMIGLVYASWGKRAEATSILANVAGRAGVSAYLVAQVHAALGDGSRAIEWLERAYQAHDPSLLMVKVDPVFEALHGDPRFYDLVRRVGLQP